MNEEDHMCVICLSEIKDDKYTLECNHHFHTSCIMNWFRSSNGGTCPCCMDSPQQGTYVGTYLGNNALMESRLSNLRRFSRKKTSPSVLKDDASTLRKLEKEEKEIKKERKTLCADESYKETFKEIKKVNRRLYNKQHRIRRLKLDIITRYPLLITH